MKQKLKPNTLVKLKDGSLFFNNPMGSMFALYLGDLTNNPKYAVLSVTRIDCVGEHMGKGGSVRVMSMPTSTTIVHHKTENLIRLTNDEIKQLPGMPDV